MMNPHGTTAIRSTMASLLFALVFVAILPTDAAALDDAQLRESVLKCIDRGQRFLISRQEANGSWSAMDVPGLSYPNGTTSLAILALLNTGKTVDDPEVASALRYLRSIPTEELEGSSTHATYEMSLMLQAFAAVRAERDKGRMMQLAKILEVYQRDSGGWRYTRHGEDSDNSATQFVLLGLREAAMAGIPVDRKVWERAHRHWLASQLGGPDSPGGSGWNYQDQQSEPAYGSMTVAGLASLVITSSMLQDDSDVTPDGKILACKPRDDTAQQAMDSAARWLASHFSVHTNPAKDNAWKLYYLYGLERAGRFSGIRFFGDHDWYREGAEFLVEGQDERTGEWSGAGSGGGMSVVESCFALLFLSKGLAPVVVNKLKFGPRDPATGEPLSNDWNRHPRDIANVIDYMTTLDRWPHFLNWQVVDLDRAVRGEGVDALLQAPIQYLSGSDRPDDIQGPQADLLREYIVQGGFLFAVQNCENSEFDAGFRDLIQRMSPAGDFQLQRLPPTHDVYRSEYIFKAESAPELWGVDVGCRTAIIYAPYDHGARWHKWARHDPPKRHQDVKSNIGKSMALALNVIAYATNRELLDKLDRPEALAKLDEDPNQRGKLSIALLRHTGGWDAAPNALRHLQSALATAGFDITAASPNVPATDPALFDYPLLYMHGRKNFAFTQDERDGLKKYLDHGGVLFADACCGATQFDASFRQMIEQMYGKPLELIPPTHEIYRLPLGHDIRQVKRRIPSTDQKDALSTQESVGPPILEGVLVDGRYVVIYSKYDISCALEQQNTLACSGYSRQDAPKIAMNMVIYALVQ